MHELGTFQIEVRGRVAESALNASSPLQVAVVESEAHGPAPGDPPEATRFTVCADQSALIGLLRHLHGHGFVILSVYRERDACTEEEK